MNCRNRLLISVSIGLICCCTAGIPDDETLSHAVRAGRLPVIKPDYFSTVIPPNIAPLNFRVEEKGEKYNVQISTDLNDGIDINASSSAIIIPSGKWRKLLEKSKGKNIYFIISVRNKNGQWVRYDTLSNKVANEDIDRYVVYRLIPPVYNLWRDMGIYQRDLQSYDESLLLHNNTIGGGCINCHTFCKNDPGTMAIRIRGLSGRGPSGGILFLKNDILKKITAEPSPVYMAWHPDGRIVTFSTNEICQFFHGEGQEVRDVIDMVSSLAIYCVDSSVVRNPPEIANPDMLETWPAWSADVFCLETVKRAASCFRYRGDTGTCFRARSFVIFARGTGRFQGWQRWTAASL